MAKKRQTRPAAMKASAKPRKAAGKPPAKKAAKTSPKAKATQAAKRPAAPPRPAGPSLKELAERLHDEIQRSKHTHVDPWAYGAKAGPWGEQVQVIVAQIAVTGDTPGIRRALEALESEVRGDRDFQEARRLL